MVNSTYRLGRFVMILDSYYLVWGSLPALMYMVDTCYAWCRPIVNY
jgi:hypothetical protein